MASLTELLARLLKGLTCWKTQKWRECPRPSGPFLKASGVSDAFRAERDSSHLAGRGLPHHGLIWRREVGWVQRPWAVDGHPVDGAEGRVGEVQVQASVRGTTAELYQTNMHANTKKWMFSSRFRHYSIYPLVLLNLTHRPTNRRVKTIKRWRLKPNRHRHISIPLQ